MKKKFLNYIREAKVGDIFYSCDTGFKEIILTIGKESTITLEISEAGAERVEWKNKDKEWIISN